MIIVDNYPYRQWEAPFIWEGKPMDSAAAVFLLDSQGRSHETGGV